MQPPSGGCVLKQYGLHSDNIKRRAAAFGRLCVETVEVKTQILFSHEQPPSGGCVLKRAHALNERANMAQPPSGGCVLKP